MKKLLFLAIAVLMLGGLAMPQSTYAYVSVKGYTKKNGTYVAPYVRSNPNGLRYDNYGYQPSQGLYNDTYGTRGTTWDTPTYITDPNYYTGKALYEANKTGSVASPVMTLPSRNVSYTAKSWADGHLNERCADSTFLRAKEKAECDTYRLLKDSYTWTVTTAEFDGRHYRYDPVTQLSHSCSDGSTILYDTKTGKPTNNCVAETTQNQPLPAGCLSRLGFSPSNGLSCSTNTCAAGLSWNGIMCLSK